MSKKLTQKEFEEKFYKKYPKQFKIIGKYRTAITPIEIQCNDCNYNFYRTPNVLDKGKTICPSCNLNGNTHETIIGTNDIWTMRPDLGKLLVNPNDGYKHRLYTSTKLLFKCPYCGKEQLSLPKRHLNDFICDYCSDGISYPNRFMTNLLDLLNISFVTEFTFKGYKYRYDFQFEYDNQQYLIEMDGALNHGVVNLKHATIEEQLENDTNKTNLAIQKGYCLIRIDCKYTDINNRKDYIINNILSSQLSSLFSFTDDLFNQANYNSQSSKIHILAQKWNEGIRSYDDLKRILHTQHRSTIRGYAKKCIELKMIDISYNDFLNEIRLASNIKLANTKGAPVICEQTKQVFYSISEASRKMNLPSLFSYFSQNYSYCGKLNDGTKLTWRKITNDEYMTLLEINERRNSYGN